MIEVTVRGISMTEAGFVVLLKGDSDERALPIAIGSAEAQAILFELNGMEFPRPLTHDLFRNVLSELGVSLIKVEINELRDETFFATLHLGAQEGRVIEMDARPSDALALALRCTAPVHVADGVMAAAGILVDKGDAHASKGADAPADPVSDLRGRLQKAISEERYEEAARLRDRLRALSGK